MEILDSWNTLAALALISGRIIILKDEVSHIGDPEESGIFRRSIGMQRGQKGDYRASITDSTYSLHLVEYDMEFELHLDRYDPSKKLFHHLVFDYLPSLRKSRSI